MTDCDKMSKTAEYAGTLKYHMNPFLLVARHVDVEVIENGVEANAIICPYNRRVSDPISNTYVQSMISAIAMLMCIEKSHFYPDVYLLHVLNQCRKVFSDVNLLVPPAAPPQQPSLHQSKLQEISKEGHMRASSVHTSCLEKEADQKR